MDLEQIKREMWETYKFTNNNVYDVYCDRCYEMSNTVCKCAEIRFMNRLTESKVEEFVKQQKENDLEYVCKQIEMKEKELEELRLLLNDIKQS